MRPNRRGRKPKPVRARRHPATGQTGKQSTAKSQLAKAPPPQAAMGVPIATNPRETKLLREMLSALCIETGQADASGKPQLLDGRLTVITFRGERIPIGAVRPLINFGVGSTRQEKQLSLMLQGTVFQIITPDGDVFTLPIHEIRGLHALSESIMQQLQAAAQSTEEPEPGKPFGFAAFTSISQGLNDRPIEPAPNDPSE